jgi:hypothetical protein|tara:strand:- start:1672 stop:3963 length:2292 start_codon:yes stop_codon:yes gene_type:complete
MLSDNLYCYEWVEQSYPDEPKFGQRWVQSGLDPLQDCWKRIRESLAVRKDIMDGGVQTDEKRGQVSLVKIWNVTDFAKKVGKFDKKAKIDDYIRNEIPQLRASRKTSTSEVHVMPPADLEYFVNDYLSRQSVDMPECYLSTSQAQEVLSLIADFKQGKIGLRELCARIGKSIILPAVAKELGIPLHIVPGYTDTIKESYRKLKGLKQWQNDEFVDTRDNQYKEIIKKALKDGKNVIAYHSMCNGGQRQNRLDFLSKLPYDRWWTVEEADRGVHREKQAKPLKKAVKKDDKVCIVTGTGGDEAVVHWETDIDPVIVSYPELLIQKRKTEKEMKKKGFKRYQKVPGLKYFQIDKQRDLLYPDFECYMMDMRGHVEDCMKSGQLDQDWSELPSWAKYSQDPTKAQSLLTRIVGSFYLGYGNRKETKLEHQLGKNVWKPEHRVDCWWFPLTKNENIEIIGKHFLGAYPGAEVIVLCGSVFYNGKRIRNNNAEIIVQDVIRKAKLNNRPVIIVASRIGERSFSIGQMTNLMLCFDKGKWNRVNQIIMRDLTSGERDKIGRIWNLSFDPNRDDKFDAVINPAVVSLMNKNKNLTSAEAYKQVIDSIDIFECTKNGLKIDKDRWTEKAIERKSMTRIFGAQTNMGLLSNEEIEQFAKGKFDYDKLSKQGKSKTGKTFEKSDVPSSKTGKNVNDRTLQKAREAIVRIYDNMDILVYSSKKKNILQIIEEIMKDKQDRLWFKNEFGIDVSYLKNLVERDVIKKEWVEMTYCR